MRLREFELPYLIPGDLTSLFLIPGVIVFLPLCVSPGATHDTGEVPYSPTACGGFIGLYTIHTGPNTAILLNSGPFLCLTVGPICRYTLTRYMG